MLAYQHCGFLVDAGVCIEARDRVALERFGVLAPNSPLRASMTAMAALAQQAAVQAESATAGESGVAPTGNALQTQPEPRPEPPKRSAAHYVWAVLIARIYEVFPLRCPMWDDGARIEPDCDLAAQPAPDFDVDQRVNW